MRRTAVAVVGVALAAASCISTTEPWSSGVRAETNATVFAEGDSVTVTLFNDASTTRYVSRCWTLLRNETGKWRVILSSNEVLTCTPVHTIAPGGSSQERVALWPAGVESPGAGTYSLWYTASPNASDFSSKTDFVESPSFGVTVPPTVLAELRELR